MPNDRTEIFKPAAKSIEKVFCDSDSFYQIPDYQRPYRWKDEQIEKLWDDVYSAMQDRAESYFLGSMILIDKKDHFEVVDGQQRLTTLTILLCVIRDLYKHKPHVVDEKLQRRICDAIKSLVKDESRLTLITQLQNQDQFEQEILNGVQYPSEDIANKKKKHNPFINAALFFKQQLEKLGKNNEAEIKLFVEYLLEKVEMITITCTKQDFAIKLFQVLNTRGLELSSADLIKSHLYGKIKDEIKKQQFIYGCWNEIEKLSTEMDEPTDDLLTYYEYYLLGVNPKASLYEELITQFKDKDPNSAAYDFKNFVKCFYEEVYDKLDKVVHTFWYLPNKVFWKTILTTAVHEKFHDFDELCKELRKLYYSYWIAGYTTSKIKQLSFNIVRWIKAGKQLADIKKEIEVKMKTDDVVKRMSEYLQDDVYDQSWLKPLLVLIEYEQTDDSKITRIELNNRLHVDHILPEMWLKVKEWKEMWTEEQAKVWLGKIGNLTLLSGKKNIAQRNDPPQKKREMYEKGHGETTAFEISKRIIKTFEESGWTEKDVRARQRWIIGEIEKIFELKLLSGDSSTIS